MYNPDAHLATCDCPLCIPRTPHAITLAMDLERETAARYKANPNASTQAAFLKAAVELERRIAARERRRTR